MHKFRVVASKTNYDTHEEIRMVSQEFDNETSAEDWYWHIYNSRFFHRVNIQVNVDGEWVNENDT